MKIVPCFLLLGILIGCTAKDNPVDTGTGVSEDADSDGWTVEGGDCDDTDPNTYPGAAEIWYDGVDQGCSGDPDFTDCDQDSDGYKWTGCVVGSPSEGEDCNDLNPQVYPAAPEAQDNLDNNCNTIVDGFRIAMWWQSENVLSTLVTDEDNAWFVLGRAPHVNGGVTGFDIQPVPTDHVIQTECEYCWVTGSAPDSSYVYAAAKLFPRTGTQAVAWGPEAQELCDLVSGGFTCADITDQILYGEDCGIGSDSTMTCWDG